MFKRILVPLDGSPRSERAIPVAARIARASGGTVILLRAVSMPVEIWPSFVVPEPGLAEAVLDADRACVEQYLADLIKAPMLDGIPTETVAFFGPPAATILSVAHSSQADLIVLCSHGYTGVTRWVLGSVAEKVVHYAPIPVFVLHDKGSVPAGAHPDGTHPLRVLVALDGSTFAKAAIEPAAQLITALATPAQGAIHLVRVVKPVSSEREESDPEGREQFLHKAKRYLSSTVEHLRARKELAPDRPGEVQQCQQGLVASAGVDLKLPITWSVAIERDVASALIRVAENGEDAEGAGVFGGCDIIAMATHGYGGMQRWAMGSITERVLSATKLPILIVRPQNEMGKGHGMWESAMLATLQA